MSDFKSIMIKKNHPFLLNEKRLVDKKLKANDTMLLFFKRFFNMISLQFLNKLKNM